MARPVVVHVVAAARPNFMKVAPLYHALRADPLFDVRVVHTGQHYDANMSDAFFRDLRLPEPHVHLGVGSGSHAEQTGARDDGLREGRLQERPDWIVVVGDVNSTVGRAPWSAPSCGSASAHLEAGLRSGDRTMPEEINRLVTDVLADLLWTPSPDGDENLRAGRHTRRTHRARRQHHARFARAAAGADRGRRHAAPASAWPAAATAW